jgi:hypothetical protein
MRKSFFTQKKFITIFISSLMLIFFCVGDAYAPGHVRPEGGDECIIFFGCIDIPVIDLIDMEHQKIIDIVIELASVRDAYNAATDPAEKERLRNEALNLDLEIRSILDSLNKWPEIGMVTSQENMDVIAYYTNRYDFILGLFRPQFSLPPYAEPVEEESEPASQPPPPAPPADQSIPPQEPLLRVPTQPSSPARTPPPAPVTRIPPDQAYAARTRVIEEMKPFARKRLAESIKDKENMAQKRRDILETRQEGAFLRRDRELIRDRASAGGPEPDI